MSAEIIIPVLGMATGIIIPLAAFYWQYLEGKEKRETAVEISKSLNDPDKIEKLMAIFEERKKEPIDYRRSGVITTFVGMGLFGFGLFFLGSILKGVGCLVGLIGIGTLIAAHMHSSHCPKHYNIFI